MSVVVLKIRLVLVGRFYLISKFEGSKPWVPLRGETILQPRGVHEKVSLSV